MTSRKETNRIYYDRNKKFLQTMSFVKYYMDRECLDKEEIRENIKEYGKMVREELEKDSTRDSKLLALDVLGIDHLEIYLAQQNTCASRSNEKRK